MQNIKAKTVGVLSLMVVLTLFSFKTTGIVKGWILAGSAPSKYEIGIEHDSKRDGNVGYIKSTKDKIKREFGTIMQYFVPDEYYGKRVRLTAYIKSADLADYASMWMRIDGEKRKTLGFDNMNKRPIKGTTDWKKYEIVLDVPKESINLAYGVIISGTGKVWLDDFKFEIVDKSVPTTGYQKKKKVKINKPMNTSFDN